jgi:hypothetical protein
MKHKISALEGALLDAAVAKAMGFKVEWWTADRTGAPFVRSAADDPVTPPQFSTDGRLGGPIIEREQITTIPGLFEVTPALARHPSGAIGEGATPLIAAMRAFVAGRFGDEVEL